MKIALFHNPAAGDRTPDGNQLIRQFGEAGYDVTYVPTSQKGWESVFRNPPDRAVIAGGDGTVSRLAPWLAALDIPFCILPLGTANNCAKTLGQDYSIDFLVANLSSARHKKVDLGVVTTPDGHHVFVESIGIGLLAQLMSEMRLQEKKKNSRDRLTPAERLAGAVKHLRVLAKEYPESYCELLLDGEPVAGNVLLLEAANMGLIGPNLNLIPNVDPSDGRFEVVWTGTDQRKEWLDYLKHLEDGIEMDPPIRTTRSRQIVLRQVDAPVHVDGKVLLPIPTPAVVRNHSGALNLLVIGD